MIKILCFKCHLFVCFVDVKRLLKTEKKMWHFNKTTDYNTRIVTKVISSRHNQVSVEWFNLTRTLPVLVWHCSTKTPWLSGFCFEKDVVRNRHLARVNVQLHGQCTIPNTRVRYCNHMMLHEKLIAKNLIVQILIVHTLPKHMNLHT